MDVLYIGIDDLLKVGMISKCYGSSVNNTNDLKIVGMIFKHHGFSVQ